MTTTFEHHIKLNDCLDIEANTALAVLFNSINNTEHELSKALLKQAINKGALWLTRGKHTQRLRRIKKKLQPDDELHFYYNEAVLASKVVDAILISDEGNYSVWYKPFGMLSQGSKYSDHCTINRFVEQYFIPQRPAFIVHRLDKAATGLMIIAHSKKAVRALASMFEDRSVHGNALEKHYQIIVHGEHNKNNQPQVITTKVNGKNARSTFSCLAYDGKADHSLISVKIDTGRKHQIRVHAASIGMPVVGDRLHGIAKNNAEQDLQLCAVSLSFNCPFSIHEAAVVKKYFELEEQLKPSLDTLK